MLAVTTVVGAVLIFSAVLGWVLLRAATSVERAQRDPGYRRRQLFVHGAISAAGVVGCCVVPPAMHATISEALPCILFGLLNVVSFTNYARRLRSLGV
jgi:hypothetical protein